MARPKVFVRAPYNYDPAEASDECAWSSDEPSLTQQHQAEDTDINVIVRRFGLTGQLPIVQNPPVYEDFPEVFDFQQAQNLIRQASESFATLPSVVRQRFNNDPAAFLAYIDEPGHEAELESWGLLARGAGHTPSSGQGGTPTPSGGDKPA